MIDEVKGTVKVTMSGDKREYKTARDVFDMIKDIKEKQTPQLAGMAIEALKDPMGMAARGALIQYGAVKQLEALEQMLEKNISE